MLRQEHEDEENKSDRWRDQHSDNDAPHSQTTLHVFLISQQPRPSRSDEAVPVAWLEVSTQPQRLHAGGNTVAQRRGKAKA